MLYIFCLCYIVKCDCIKIVVGRNRYCLKCLFMCCGGFKYEINVC